MRQLLHTLCALCCGTLAATDLHVDNLRGDDRNDGSKKSPFKTIAAGYKALKGGDTLNLVPNSVPYNEEIRVKGDKRGAAGKPTVIDGHGAKLCRLSHFAADQWVDEGAGVYSMKFRNNCVTMASRGYWNGFPIVFLDGKPSQWVKSREELKPDTYLLVFHWDAAKQAHGPLHNTLFVRLPEGKTPADVKIEAPGCDACVAETDYVVFRNLEVSYSAADAFDTCWGKGIVFENISGSYCMDQGVSGHSADGAVIRDARFDHAICFGAKDINMAADKPCKVKYVNCLFEDNLFCGGAGFWGGEFEMESCVLRNNEGAAVAVAKGVELKLRDCLILGSGNPKAEVGVSVDGGSIEMSDCTISGFKTGFSLVGPGSAKIANCVFQDCATSLALPGTGVVCSGNRFAGATTFKTGGFETADFDEYRRRLGLAPDAADASKTVGASVRPQDVGPRFNNTEVAP